LDVTDKTITLGSGQIEANSGGSGIIVDGSGASILWDETNTEWDFNTRINVPSAFSQYYSIRESGTQYGFIGQYKTLAGTGTDTSLTIFSETGDGINFTVNGSVTKAVVIDADGDVGIGDTSPSFKLDVNNTSSRVRFKASSGDSTLEMSAIAGRDYAIQSLSDGRFRIYDEDANADRLIIDTNGEFNPTGVLYLGSGHNTSAPSDGVIAAAYADGYNNAGGDLKLYGGGSTGDNGGGEIQFFTGAAGSPGTQINSHTHRMTITSDGRIGFGEAAGNVGHRDVEGKMDLRMDMSGVNWTHNDWSSVWNSSGTPGSNFNKAVLHLDTNRFGGSTGGIVGIAFSPGWQGHQNWGIYSHNRSGGSSSEGDLSFVNQINAGNIQERFRIKADGNVGIGEPSPDTLLHLTKESTSSDVDYIKLEMNSWSGHTNYLKSLVWSDGSNNIAAIGAEYDGSKTNIHFHSQYSGGYNGTSTRTMSILGNGNVGIGTTGPEAKLHVKGTGQFDMLTIERSASTPGVKFVSGADTAGTFGFQLMDNNEWWSGVYNGSSYDYWIQANTDVLRVKKPISSFTDSGTKQYSHLCTGSFYQSTGAIVIDTNIPGYNSTGNANMFSIKIRGYEYGVHGSIDMAIGGYVGENNHYSINYNGNYVPEGWVDSVQFCKNNTTGKLAIVLGSTAAAQRIEMAVVDFIQGFQNVNESYAKGWSISCLTSLSNYSNFSSAEPRISNPRPGFHAYLSSSTTFTAGTAARTLASTTYNRGSHYNTSNGRFTAPTDGVYHFDMALQMTSSSVNQTYISAEVRVNGGTRYIGGWYNKTTGGNNGTATYSAATGSVTIQLGRGDYIEFICELSNTDTALGGLAGYTYLSGVQIG
jgi:hypothetical protein